MSRITFICVAFVLGIVAGTVFGVFPLAGIICVFLPAIVMGKISRVLFPVALLAITMGFTVQRYSDVPDAGMPDSACRRIVEGTVVELPRKSHLQTRLTVAVVALSECITSKTPPPLAPFRASAYVTVGKSDTASLQKGARIRFSAHCQPAREYPVAPLDDTPPRFFLRATLHSASDILILNPSGPLEIWLEGRRAQIRQLFRSALSESDAAIALALTTGQKHQLSKKLSEQFKATGTAHLLAVSGLHLGILALLTYRLSLTLLRRISFFARRGDVSRSSALITIPAIVFFALLTGAHPPVVRACIMALSVLIATVLRRQSSARESLILAMALLLADSPQLVVNAGFQLSFASVAGFFLFQPAAPKSDRRTASPSPDFGLSPTGPPSASVAIWLQRCCQKTVQYMVQISYVAVIACAVTSPILAFHFHTAAPLAPLANVLAVPVVSLVAMPLLILSMAVSWVYFPAGVGLARICAYPLWALQKIIDAISHISPVVDTTQPGMQLVVLVLSTAAICLLLRKFLPGAFLVVAGSILCACLLATRPSLFARGEVTVDFLDMGQGDATLVTFPGGSHWLIDGGGTARQNIGEEYLVPLLQKMNVTSIAKLIVTHPDPDHVMGIPDVLRHFSVQEIWDTGQGLEENSGPAYREMIQLSAKMNIPVKKSAAICGYRQVEGATVELVHPCGTGSYLPTLSFNDNSIVLRIAYGGTHALLTGDLGAEGEQYLLQRHPSLESQLLKLGHHGSAGSTTVSFLNQIRPQYAVASCGFHNRYLFPSTAVLDRLKKGHTRLLRTDRDGHIRATMSRSGLRIHRQKSPDNHYF